MNYRTLVFDFDGTIADTLGETRLIFNELAPEFGFRTVPDEEIARLRDFSLTELLEHLEIPKHRVPVLLTRGTARLRARIESLPLIPGMGQAVPELRRHADRLGILTSNTTSNVEAFLEVHGMRGAFDFISSTSRLTGKAKHLRAILKTFSLRPAETLYVGDELRDLRAARKAGIPFAAVTWGFNSRKSLAAKEPEHLLGEPGELLRLVARRG
jgi:phosphoglycolate phosphatase